MLQTVASANDTNPSTSVNAPAQEDAPVRQQSVDGDEQAQ